VYEADFSAHGVQSALGSIIKHSLNTGAIVIPGGVDDDDDDDDR